MLATLQPGAYLLRQDLWVYRRLRYHRQDNGKSCGTVQWSFWKGDPLTLCVGGLLFKFLLCRFEALLHCISLLCQHLKH